MIASKSPRRALSKIPPKKIPAALIYEIIDGKPVYYKGYREVLAQRKTIQEIMGSSNLQSTLFEYLLMIFFKTFNLCKYRILTNKIGIHISKSNNLSGDAIYEKRDLPVSQADKHYIAIPPKFILK